MTCVNVSEGQIKYYNGINIRHNHIVEEEDLVVNCKIVQKLVMQMDLKIKRRSRNSVFTKKKIEKNALSILGMKFSMTVLGLKLVTNITQIDFIMPLAKPKAAGFFVFHRESGYFLHSGCCTGSQVLLQSYCASFTLLVVQQLSSPVH